MVYPSNTVTPSSLTAGATYLNPGGYSLQGGQSGTGTITIESSDIYNNLGHLTAGTRVGPSLAQYMPKIESSSGNADLLKTITTDGTPHDWTFLGIEFAPNVATVNDDALIELGDSTSTQNAVSLVPYNFTIDRCYIHGYDDTGAVANQDPNTEYEHGLRLNCLNATVENSYISDIHNTGSDAQAIGGSNGLGNFTITNNFLEATGEDVLFGGGTNFIPNACSHQHHHHPQLLLQAARLG